MKRIAGRVGHLTMIYVENGETRTLVIPKVDRFEVNYGPEGFFAASGQALPFDEQGRTMLFIDNSGTHLEGENSKPFIPKINSGTLRLEVIQAARGLLESEGRSLEEVWRNHWIEQNATNHDDLTDEIDNFWFELIRSLTTKSK